MSKAAKRQRKKDQRRQKIEEEMRRYRAKRRRRMTINLAVVGLVVVGLTALVSAQRSKEAKDQQPTCKHDKPPTGDASQVGEPPLMTIDQAKTYTATIDTSCGEIVIALAGGTAPKTVNSFIFLARRGFYDGLTFHRIVPAFAIQGGDPKGDGSGGPGYQVVEAPSPETKYDKGAVAMAKTQADPAGASGSQFFIVPGARGAELNGTSDSPALYAVLGKVTDGFEVLRLIERVPRGTGPNAEKPQRPIYIIKITITES